MKKKTATFNLFIKSMIKIFSFIAIHGFFSFSVSFQTVNICAKPKRLKKNIHLAYIHNIWYIGKNNLAY